MPTLLTAICRCRAASRAARTAAHPVRAPAWAARATLVALAALAAWGAPQVALAQSDWELSAYKGWTVSSLRVVGLGAELTDALSKGLVFGGSSKLIFGSRPKFYPQDLEKDIKRAELFLARRGYPYASVSARFEPNARAREVGVILDVESGPAVRVRSVDIAGLPPEVTIPAAELPLAAPWVFREDLLNQSVAQVRERIREHGYARASVSHRLTPVDSTHLDVTIEAESGAVYVFGDVIVKGVAPDLERLARKTAAVDRGRTYSPKIVKRATDQIRLLGLFRQVRIDVVDDGPDTLDVVADLLPRAPRSLETALGYWTDELVRGRVRWMHRNLFKGGRGVMFQVSASQFLQAAETSFWWPAMIGSRTRGVATVEFERQNEESYDLTSIGSEFSLWFQYSLSTSIRVGVSVADVEVDSDTDLEDAFVEKGGLLTFLFAHWQRDTTDDRISPTRGTVTSIETEWAPDGPQSDNYFALVEASGTVYRRVVGSAVFATRLTVGAATPTASSTDLLPNKRFYAGGASSMRGFRRRRLGPSDPAGAAIGGEAKLEWSAELRFPLISVFQGAVFFDTGQAWRTFDDITADDIETAAGGGLRVMTPVGPIRFDVGYRLTDYDQSEKEWAYHISIGYPF